MQPPVAGHPVPQHAQHVAVAGPRVYDQGQAPGQRQPQLPCEDLLLLPSVVREGAEKGVGVIEAELAPSDALRPGTVEGRQQARLQFVVVGPRRLRVAAEGGEDLGVLQGVLQGAVQAVGIAALRDASGELRAEGVPEATLRIDLVLGVPRALRETQRERRLVLGVGQDLPTSQVVGVEGQIRSGLRGVALAICPIVPALLGFAQDVQHSLRLLRQFAPIPVWQQPGVPIPRVGPVPDRFGGALLLRRQIRPPPAPNAFLGRLRPCRLVGGRTRPR
mmetsp:Transcript_38289/g.110450  ORF Transcript_38289/g.110450 Transcript_38289/m.110450 type:complete len:276 (-) Transcript_38289:388-1215(-)